MEFDFVSDMPQERLATEVADGNAKHKRIVCRFWLANECIHDHRCKFLHVRGWARARRRPPRAAAGAPPPPSPPPPRAQVRDLSKMPECRWGAKCQKTGAP